MATTINGVSRYASDGSVDTSFAGVDSQFGNLEVIQVPFGAASATTSVIAPFGGKLVAAYVTSQTTTDGTNTVTLAIKNESNSSAAMVTGVTYDADPVLTTNVAQALTVTTANAAVDKGDNIEVAYTEGGTIAGGCVALYFEMNAD